MVKYIASNAILDLFDTFKTVSLTNSIISKYFNNNQFFEFRPKGKSITFKKDNYIVFHIPETPTEFEDLMRKLDKKKLQTEVLLVNNWDARDNVRVQCNNLMSVHNGARSTYRDAGWDDAKLEFVSADREIEDQQEVVVARFKFTAEAMVEE